MIDSDSAFSDSVAMIFTGFSGGTRTSRSTAVIRVGAVLGIKVELEML